MVKHFLLGQQKKLLSQKYQDIVLFIASIINKGQTITQNIIRCEKSCVTDNKILCCKKAKDFDL